MFSTAQLQAAGFDRRRLTLLVAQGRIVRRHQGVYGDALVRPTQRSHLVAALLAAGDTAFVSRRTALALCGVRRVNLHEIEVTVVAEHTPRLPGLRVHRTRVAPEDHETRLVNGLCVASPSLALVEAAGRETAGELDRLISELARRRLLDLERIDASAERRSGLPGVARLRAALARYRPLVHDVSTLERDLAAWLDEDPRIPTPRRNVRIEDTYEVDFFWPDHGVVLEADGEPYHRTPAELERDRVKDAWLQCRGLRVMRVSGFRFAHDRPGILVDLTTMLDP